MADPTLQAWNILGSEPAPSQAAPQPDDRWPLPGGFALVYYANKKTGLTRPVILADGFNSGPSQPDAMWEHVELGQYRLASALKDRGSDLIMLGYDERAAPIQTNARAAVACIQRASDEMHGDAAMAVGGFSMGGLVTRYALCRMESQRADHRTGLYFSYDSPHRGAWIPISLQALAHYIKDEDGIIEMSDHINSPAARQLLWRHIATVDAEPAQDDLRARLLRELDDLGGWPHRPDKIGVANGAGRGTGLQIQPGDETLKVTGLAHPYRTTTLYAQASGDQQLVALLKRQRLVPPQPPAVEKRTSGLPELDAAPGGILRSFGIARDTLAQLGAVQSDHEWVDFVPAVSAVAIRDLDRQEDVYADIESLPGDDSELDEFKCASDNQEHSLVTAQLAEWLLTRLPK